MTWKHFLKICGIIATAFIIVACGNGESTSESGASDEPVEVSIGVVGAVSEDIWLDVADRLANQGINLDVVTFTDYNTPNTALEDGDLDLNAFQHMAFLTEYISDRGESSIVPVGYTIVSPMYIFSVDSIPDVESIPEGATVAVSNSPTNAERAYLGLQDIGLIELDENAGFAPTPDDIVANPGNIEILEVAPNQIARSLGDADLITIGGDMLSDAGMDPADAIYVDTDDIENIDPLKKNIIASREEDAGSETVQTIVDEYQSEETAAYIEEISGGSSIPIWTESDDIQGDFQEAMNNRTAE